MYKYIPVLGRKLECLFSGSHLVIKEFMIMDRQGGRIWRRDPQGWLKWVELAGKGSRGRWPLDWVLKLGSENPLGKKETEWGPLWQTGMAHARHRGGTGVWETITKEAPPLRWRVWQLWDRKGWNPANRKSVGPLIRGSGWPRLSAFSCPCAPWAI